VAGFDVAKTGVARIGFIGTKYTAKGAAMSSS